MKRLSQVNKVIMILLKLAIEENNLPKVGHITENNHMIWPIPSTLELLIKINLTWTSKKEGDRKFRSQV